MKLVLTEDNGKEHVFEEVTDCYLAIRVMKPVTNKEKKVAFLPETRSYSWTSNLREIIKELRQSVPELQKMIDKQMEEDKHGGE